jgi:hypothetical protein
VARCISDSSSWQEFFGHLRARHCGPADLREIRSIAISNYSAQLWPGASARDPADSNSSGPGVHFSERYSHCNFLVTCVWDTVARERSASNYSAHLRVVHCGPVHLREIQPAGILLLTYVWHTVARSICERSSQQGLFCSPMSGTLWPGPSSRDPAIRDSSAHLCIAHCGPVHLREICQQGFFCSPVYGTLWPGASPRDPADSSSRCSPNWFSPKNMATSIRSLLKINFFFLNNFRTWSQYLFYR